MISLKSRYLQAFLEVALGVLSTGLAFIECVLDSVKFTVNGIPLMPTSEVQIAEADLRVKHAACKQNSESVAPDSRGPHAPS